MFYMGNLTKDVIENIETRGGAEGALIAMWFPTYLA